VQLEIQIAEYRIGRRFQHLEQRDRRIAAQMPRRAGEYPRQGRRMAAVRHQADPARLDARVPVFESPRFRDRDRREPNCVFQAKNRGAATSCRRLEVTGLGRIERPVGDEALYGVGLDQKYGRQRGPPFGADPGLVEIETERKCPRNIDPSGGLVERGIDVVRVRSDDQNAPHGNIAHVIIGPAIRDKAARVISRRFDAKTRPSSPSPSSPTLNRPAETMFYSYMDSPIGPLLLAGSRHALKVIGFSRGDKARDAETDWERLDEPFGRVKRQLQEYFDGERRAFDVPLAPDGTDFQRAVWHALTTIPYGTTLTYRDIAMHVDHPNALRAVGAANGANPIPIIIPCHRVIGSDGSLTGFGGGLDSKRWLLDLERSRSGLFGANR
jgi:methylated-DNA-[protein]-cysteine S-methyltransferase